MQTIRLTTVIDAPLERCFLLALSRDLRALSMNLHPEHSPPSPGTAGAGDLQASASTHITSGPLHLNSSITWSKRRLGRFTSRIDAWRPNAYFREIITGGRLSFFEHDHHFAAMGEGTRMRDEIRFSAPSLLFQSLLEARLRSRLKSFIVERNLKLTAVAQSNDWHQFLNPRPAPSLPYTQTASTKPAPAAPPTTAAETRSE